MNHRHARFTQFLSLSAMQQRTLLAAWLWLPLFWLGLRLLGLPRFQAYLLQTPVKSLHDMALADIRAQGRAVNIATRYTPFPATCLTRSLLLGWLLQRRGVKSQLRIGVRFKQGVLDAHAWVECDGIAVNDRPDVSAQFASFGDLIPLKAFNAP